MIPSSNVSNAACNLLPYKSYALTIMIGVALIDRGDYNLQSVSTTPRKEGSGSRDCS